MRGTTMVTAVLAASALALCTSVALAASWSATTSGKGAMTTSQAAKGIQLHGITGRVTAVDPATRTLTVEGAVVEGQENKTVRMIVNDQSDIRHGWFHRKLSDVKVGQHVRIV